MYNMSFQQSITLSNNSNEQLIRKLLEEQNQMVQSFKESAEQLKRERDFYLKEANYLKQKVTKISKTRNRDDEIYLPDIYSKDNQKQTMNFSDLSRNVSFDSDSFSPVNKRKMLSNSINGFYPNDLNKKEKLISKTDKNDSKINIKIPKFKYSNKNYNNNQTLNVKPLKIDKKIEEKNDSKINTVEFSANSFRTSITQINSNKNSKTKSKVLSKPIKLNDLNFKKETIDESIKLISNLQNQENSEKLLKENLNNYATIKSVSSNSNKFNNLENLNTSSIYNKKTILIQNKKIENNESYITGDNTSFVTNNTKMTCQSNNPPTSQVLEEINIVMDSRSVKDIGVYNKKFTKKIKVKKCNLNNIKQVIIQPKSNSPNFENNTAINSTKNLAVEFTETRQTLEIPLNNSSNASNLLVSNLDICNTETTINDGNNSLINTLVSFNNKIDSNNKDRDTSEECQDRNVQTPGFKDKDLNTFDNNNLDKNIMKIETNIETNSTFKSSTINKKKISLTGVNFLFRI